MTRKDYEFFAALVVALRTGNVSPGWVMTRMAEHFQADNPRFDRERFEIAAGRPS